ncbi:MAG: PAS domain S-box protein, partial [Flavobacteriales bacterium]|nr:PAS domain S-box protein [Flavobacteriales bacterium]
KDENTKLSGQIYVDAENQIACFLGTPLIHSFHDLPPLQLNLSDFATHDSIGQYLFSLQRLTSSIDDGKILAEKLEQSNSELKVVNSTVIKNEKIFSTFFENTSIGMLLDTPEGNHVLANEAIHKMLNYDFEKKELIGTGFLDITVPEDREKSKERVKYLVDNKTTGVQLTKRYLTKDNKILWAKTTISCIKDSNDEVINIIVLVEDLTDTKKAEGERDRLFNNSTDLICVANIDGYFESINPALSKTLGYTDEKILSTKWIEFVHPEDVDRTLAEIKNLLIEHKTIGFQNRFLCEDQSYKWLSWSINKDEMTNNFFATARDITEKVKIQETLERSNNELQQFAYIATHDLKVPIDNIKGYHNALLKDIDTENKRANSIMNWIEVSVNQANGILDDLVKLAREENLEFDKELLDLNHIYDSVKESLERKLKEHNGVITADFSAFPHVKFSKRQLISIFQNLLSNAIKYHSPDRPPQIKVISKKVGKFVCIKFIDNGLGIDMTTQKEKLFGLFKRIHTNAEGSGMGLYLIKKEIEKSGGKIKVESEVGKGSTFKVYLNT